MVSPVHHRHKARSSLFVDELEEKFPELANMGDDRIDGPEVEVSLRHVAHMCLDLLGIRGAHLLVECLAYFIEVHAGADHEVGGCIQILPRQMVELPDGALLVTAPALLAGAA